MSLRYSTKRVINLKYLSDIWDSTCNIENTQRWSYLSRKRFTLVRHCEFTFPWIRHDYCHRDANSFFDIEDPAYIISPTILPKCSRKRSGRTYLSNGIKTNEYLHALIIEYKYLNISIDVAWLISVNPGFKVPFVYDKCIEYNKC